MFENDENVQGAPLEDSPEPQFDVTVDGQQLKVPQSELLKGYSRNADYTRKTQALAEREREWQGKLTQYESAMEEIAGFLENEEKLKAYIAKRFAQQQQQDPSQPSQYLTPQQLEAKLAQMHEAQEKRLVALQTEMAVNQMAQQMGARIDARLNQLKKEHPQVFFRPGMERLIREEVNSMGSSNLEEAIKNFEIVVKGYAADLAKTTSAPANVRGIEPPGGVAMMPKAGEDFGDVRDPRLREQVMQDIIRGMKGQ